MVCREQVQLIFPVSDTRETDRRTGRPRDLHRGVSFGLVSIEFAHKSYSRNANLTIGDGPPMILATEAQHSEYRQDRLNLPGHNVPAATCHARAFAAATRRRRYPLATRGLCGTRYGIPGVTLASTCYRTLFSDNRQKFPNIRLCQSCG